MRMYVVYYLFLILWSNVTRASRHCTQTKRAGKYLTNFERSRNEQKTKQYEERTECITL